VRARIRNKSIHPLKPRTCRVLEDDARARASASQSMVYVECDVCGGRVEVWNVEDTSSCLDCLRARVGGKSLNPKFRYKG
jgi:hypothetical protein